MVLMPHGMVDFTGIRDVNWEDHLKQQYVPVASEAYGIYQLLQGTLNATVGGYFVCVAHRASEEQMVAYQQYLKGVKLIKTGAKNLAVPVIIITGSFLVSYIRSYF